MIEKSWCARGEWVADRVRICPKSANSIWTNIVRPMYANIGQTRAHRGPALDLKARILDRMSAQKPFLVWTPVDFLDLGARPGVDKALQRLAKSNAIRRIDRGVYDVPTVNRLTGRVTTPDDKRSSTPSRGAIKFEFSWTASRQQTSSALPMPLPPMSSFILMLGFVPSNWAKLTIAFKLTAPSRLYWAGRPAMRVVQALHWVRDLLPTDQNRILKRLQSIISDPTHGAAIRQDLAAGIHTLPTWMQDLVRNATFQTRSCIHVGSVWM